MPPCAEWTSAPAPLAGVPVWRPGEPVARLAALLDRGGLLAFPTESSYGLGADPGNAAGVEAVYRLKERERGRPLPVVVAERADLAALGVDPALPILDRLAAFWPGALSIALPLAVPLPAAAGGDSIAVRVPGHAGLRRLLVELGRPLTATSANRSGEDPLLEPGAVGELLAGGAGSPGCEAALYDGGSCPGGPPSTLVEPLAGDAVRLLRPGRVPAAEIARHCRVYSVEGLEIAAR